jgi:hypothetical protein
VSTNKKRRRSATQDSVVAYHEAGHAVASWHLHLKINGATIIPEGDSLGHVSHPPIPKRETQTSALLKIASGYRWRGGPWYASPEWKRNGDFALRQSVPTTGVLTIRALWTI